jgi:hypothetical protein
MPFKRLKRSSLLPEPRTFDIQCVCSGKSYCRERLSTVDHLVVLRSLDQLLFILKILFNFLTKQATLMRSYIVLSLPAQLAFPGLSIHILSKSNFKIWREEKQAPFKVRLHGRLKQSNFAIACVFSFQFWLLEAIILIYAVSLFWIYYRFYCFCGATTFTIMAFSIMAFSIMTFSIMTFSIMSFSIMTFSIMTLSIRHSALWHST